MSMYNDDDDDYDAPSPWERQTAHHERMAPVCKVLYKTATRLQVKAQGGKKDLLHCNARAIQNAVAFAFTGPCGRARKKLNQALVSCRLRRTGMR